MLLAEAYLHTLDPFAIEFPASWARAPLVPDGIRWYGLSYAAGFVIAWALLRLLARSKRFQLPVEAVGDLLFYIIMGVLIGGRLGWAIFYQRGAPLVTFDSSFPFWELLKIHQGGMASHGGMIGLIAACCVFAWRRKLSSLHILDMAAFVCPPGLFLGRTANFINAELPGRRLPAEMQATSPSWSVKYPEELHTLTPDRLHELAPAVEKLEGTAAEWNDAVARIGFDVEAEVRLNRLTQNVVDAVREGDQAVGELVRPLLDAYYPSQLIQALAEGPVLMAIMALVWLKPRRPGVIGCVFLVTYALLRIATETVRQPDEGVELFLGLSRGQVLSVLMLLSGLVAWPIVASRTVEPLGGLRPPRG